MSAGARAGLALLAAAVASAVAAPVAAPHAVDQQFRALLNAPPTIPHVIDAHGSWHRPFIYRWRLADRLEQRYEQDRSAPVPLAWLTRGRLVGSTDDNGAPLMLAGTDTYGRDLFSRLLYGARISLGLALVAALGATIVGGLLGGIAGYAGGLADEWLMRCSEFVLVLPVIYVALALRAVMPLVLAPRTVFLMLAAIFAIVGAPFVARGVRTIVRSERNLEYAIAARSLGAGHARLLLRHLLPATRGYIVVQLTVLVPAFIIAEATLSYVGLGFPDPIASWGAMLHDAANVRVLADFPWLISPAAAIFVVVLALNLVLQRPGVNPVQFLLMELSGVFAPLPTPFDEVGAVDTVKLRTALGRWIAQPLTGFVVLGSNGEAVFLDEDESDRVIAAARESVPAGRPLIIGAGRESTQATVRAVRRAAELGADYVLVRTPGFFKSQMTTEAFVRHYSIVADASPVPVLLYNFTAMTGVSLLPAAVARLAPHPNIAGMKESGGDVAQIMDLVCSTPDDFAVLAGATSTFYAALCVGCAGGILAVASVAPEACARLFERTRAGDHDGARRLQQQLLPLARLIGPTYGVPGLKAALKLAGYDVGMPRAPLAPVPSAGVAALRAALAQFEEVVCGHYAESSPRH